MKHTALFLFIAVLLVAACGPTHEERLAQLEQLEQWNRADSVMRYDSLALLLTDYFDSHGTSNERLRAHYILGRTYADLGESPRALDCYHDALSYADTTATDCDYKALVGIHGQMAVIFHQQNLTQDEIRAISQYIHCMQRAYPNDTLRYLLAKGQLVRPYYLMGETDTVLQIIECINKQLEQIGHQQEAARGLGTAIYIYTKRGQIAKARQLLAIYEQESNLFDTEGNIAQGREDYYWIKGLYEIAVGQIDSAEYYFRKGIQYGGLEAVSSSYKGMLSVYQHKHNLDSVVYYSRLNEAALDSLHNRMQTDAIHQASALYDYTRSEKLAKEEARKRREAWYWFWGLLACGILLTGISILLYKKKQRERQEAIHQLTAALTVSRAEQQNVKEELEKLKSKNYEDLIVEKEKKEQEQEHRIITLEQEIGHAGEPKPQNRYDDFKNSQIVGVFGKKALFSKDHPIPNKAEWNVLINQFRTDMPATYQFFFDGKKLSPLELYTCILLILDYEEGVIVGLTQTSSSAVSIAKSRANQKLFHEKSAITLKYNLKKVI